MNGEAKITRDQTPDRAATLNDEQRIVPPAWCRSGSLSSVGCVVSQATNSGKLTGGVYIQIGAGLATYG